MQTVKALRAKYGDLYTEKNVCISSTHTHAGPGGFLQYALYIVTSQGFIRQSFDSLIQGILKVRLVYEIFSCSRKCMTSDLWFRDLTTEGLGGRRRQVHNHKFVLRDKWNSFLMQYAIVFLSLLLPRTRGLDWYYICARLLHQQSKELCCL